MTLPESPKVYLCQECGERGDEPLVAPDPFNPDSDLYACQHCRTPECLQRACVIEGCTAPPCAGTPGAHGYRYAWTCQFHHDFSNRKETT